MKVLGEGLEGERRIAFQLAGDVLHALERGGELNEVGG